MRWTEYYHLPQWESEDITTWKGQLNDAFAQLDNVLYIIGHQTYASPDDVELLQSKINELHELIESGEGSTAELKVLVGQLSEQIRQAEETYQQKYNDVLQLLSSLSLEIHSNTARLDLLEKEMAEIGKKLTAWYFPCMDGTTLPGVDDIPNTEGGE